MLKFTALLSPESIRQGLICSSKKTALELAGRLLAEQADNAQIDETTCFECLFNREKLGGTALGNGIAMPRARIPQGDKPLAVLLQFSTPIDYQAGDNRDVDLMLALLIPDDLCQDYSAQLAQLSERFKDKILSKQLRAAQSAVEIWQILQNADKVAEEKALEAEENP